MRIFAWLLASLVVCSCNANETADCNAISEVAEVISKNSSVAKTIFSPTHRVIFFAGVGGTGHHLFQTVVQRCENAGMCKDASFRKLLWKATSPKAGLWSRGPVPDYEQYCTVKEEMRRSVHNSSTSPFTLHIVNTLDQTGKTGMLSYPNYYRVNARSQPDMKQLAYMGEKIGADVRILVLLRSPFQQLSSVYRRFGKNSSFARTVYRFSRSQLRFLQQLQSLDKRFYTCVDFDSLRDSSGDVEELFLRGAVTSQGNAEGTKLFSFKQALDDIINPDKVSKYPEPTADIATLIESAFRPNFSKIEQLCAENAVYQSHA